MYRLLIFLLTAFLIACSIKSPDKSAVYQMKRLEYNRSSDLQKWTDIYNSQETPQGKRLVLDSMGKTRIALFAPFYQQIISHSKDDSTIQSAIFALGQIKDPKVTKILLSLKPDSLPGPAKKAFIRALGRKACPQSVNMLRPLVRNKMFRDAALMSLAFCAKKNIEPKISHSILDTLLAHPGLGKAGAYLAQYASYYSDIPQLIQYLNGSSGLTLKYLLKSLSHLFEAHPDRFEHIVRADSSLDSLFKAEIQNTLRGKAAWQIKLYALKLSPVFSDSAFTDVVIPFLHNSSIHLQNAAIKTLAKMDGDRASAEFLNLLNSKPNSFLRGELLKSLSNLQPGIAYGYIVQDLSRGNAYYRASMLEALSHIKRRVARKTLKQYLSIQTALLRNTAFLQLDRMNRLSSRDVGKFMKTGEVSSLVLSLDWQSKHNQILPLAQLLNLFQTYHHPIDFELQRAVIRSIKKKYSSRLDSSGIDLLWNSAGHPLIQQELKTTFPKPFSSFRIKENRLTLLPNYLQPDSIPFNRSHSFLKIETTRGPVILKLLWQAAPLTCKNFTTLASNHLYDGLPFHRVIADFVVQGGDPLKDGWGGPPYLIPSEDNALNFQRGSVGMATSGFDTGGSQFFICLSEQPHLTGNYTLFATVIEGMEVVDRIIPGDKIIRIEETER